VPNWAQAVGAGSAPNYQGEELGLYWAKDWDCTPAKQAVVGYQDERWRRMGEPGSTGSGARATLDRYWVELGEEPSATSPDQA
jgi:hypothetical protein